MNDLHGMLAELAKHPDDEVTRAIMADLLDESGPTPVKLWGVPLWLLRRWQRYVSKQDRQSHVGTMSTRIYFHCWIQQVTREEKYPVIEHQGQTIISDMKCFVTEPYALNEDAPFLFRSIAATLGIVHGFARLGHWHSGTVRGILFPVTITTGVRLDQ